MSVNRNNHPYSPWLFRLFILALLILPPSALRANNPLASQFEMDGNAVDQSVGPPDDWDTLLGFAPGGSGMAIDKVFIPDFYATPNTDLIFTIGGSKDINDISQWSWTLGSVPDKDDIAHAFAGLYPGDNPGGAPHFVFGLDRYAVNGDAQLGFWLMQHPTVLATDSGGNNYFSDGTLDAGGEPTRVQHENGDVLVLVHFTQGGSSTALELYQWVGAGPAGSLQLVYTGLDCSNPNPTQSCSAVNAGGEPSPWPYTPKSGPANIFPAGSFFEGDVDLEAFFSHAQCFSSFLAETRSSQETSAQLKDFALGSLESCSFSVQKSGPQLSKVGDPADYTYTINNTGFAPLYLDSIVDDRLGDLKSEAAAAGCGTLAPASSCSFTHPYTVQAGDPDPLVNTVTVVLNDAQDLTGIQFTHTASFSVNLFQPSVTVAKTGPSKAQVGDTVTYVFNVTNTSSSDAPPLVLASVTDTVLGDLTAIATAAGCGTLASGASCSFSAAYTIPASSPNPLVNTVTVLYHPRGFPNDITDHASHSTDLFVPSLRVTKTGSDLSKIGDPASFTFSIFNTSTPNSPNLALVSAADSVLGSLMAEATAAGCASLAPGASCSFSKSRTTQAGDPDPLVNSFSAHYNPVGWVTDVSASASHTTNLFQPSVAVQKNGPALAKVGDSVTYAFMITNTSSADSPALNLASVTDSIIGSLMTQATAAGCASLPPGGSCSFSASRTVMATDPDPLVNTVSVLYHPQGFPNDITAQASHSLNLFQPSVAVVKSGDALGKITDPVHYTFTITNTSSSDTPPLVLASVVDPLIGDLTAPAAAAGCGTLAPAASCSFTASRVVLANDPDPLVNTVTVTYSPQGTAASVSASSSHTTNLFQPSVTVAKSGPSLAKVGDSVTYGFTITNTSSADSPDLILASVSDSIIGSLMTEAAAAGCTTLASGASCSFTKSRTVLQSDSDPLVNIVSVLYHPTGFPNDIAAQASHSLDLYQPSVSVVKTGDNLGKIGDPVNYAFTITNTSSPDTPALTLVSVLDPLIGNLTPVAAAAGCGTLAPGASCSFAASRSVQLGDPDPLVNTVTVTYLPQGTSGAVTASSSHTTNLFQPSVSVAKNGPSVAEVGSSVPYTFTITNTSSPDSPPLNLAAVSDTIIGSLMADATAAGCASLAPGASCSFVKNRTVQAGDPDPLVNTVNVLYHPSGFPNNITASASHTLNLFNPALSVQKSGTALSKVGDPATYNFTITNTSSPDSPPLVLSSVSDNIIGSLTADATAAGCSVLAPGASCSFSRTRIVQPGDPDPLINTVTAHYTPQGFANDVNASASHTTNLFQPRVSVSKTGPAYAMIGETVTYGFTITNTSSPDSPPLNLASVSDSLMGDITALAAPTCGTLAPGASGSFTVDRVVLAGDPDPLVNTVSVLYHPDGFPNNITASSRWVVNIIHPDGQITKTCLTNPVPVGASANFRINVYNTGDVPLVTHLTDPLLGVDTTFTLGVQPSAGYCTDLTNDPANGCYLLEVGVIATGSQVDNTATIDDTLPAQYGIPGIVYSASASATCTVQSGGATRTQGFWATHLDYTTHVFTVHLGGAMDIGWKQLTGVDDVMGIFWANNAKDSQGKKRSQLCQARETVANQVVAAILNSALSNGAPLPVPLAQIQSIMAGTDVTAIRNLGTTLGTYNQSGDTTAIVDNDGYLIQPADPQGAKAIADIPFADCP